MGIMGIHTNTSRYAYMRAAHTKKPYHMNSEFFTTLIEMIDPWWKVGVRGVRVMVVLEFEKAIDALGQDESFRDLEAE
jgi:hypothetical protein